ncbi:MAG: hypothetical protein MUC38_00990 [Cyclobacteriaceae bacterium]|jgi:hypothetical protein|nr:hypothetical protein [Cyclobacteriaceae bacterium]
MKILLDIREKRKASFFLDLIKQLDYVRLLKIIDDPQKGKLVNDLSDAFREVHLYEKGKKKLKTAKQLLDEL